ncbi:hypothetical protein AMTRI_Chr06g198360 [Amborella trichopoda]
MNEEEQILPANFVLNSSCDAPRSNDNFQFHRPTLITDAPFSYICSLFHHHLHQWGIRRNNGGAAVGAGARWVQRWSSTWCGLFTFSALFKACSATQQKKRAMVDRRRKREGG